MTTSFEVDAEQPVRPDLVKSTKERSWEDPRRLTQEGFEKQLPKVGLKTLEGFAFNTTNPIAFQRPDANSFLETCRLAYDEHVPLVLGPDEVWTAIVQATSAVVRSDPEAARRSMGVQHEGKKDLLINIPDFVKGAKDNPWERAFGMFGDKLAENVGKRRDLFDPTFSTTGVTEKAVMQVQMLDAFAPFFECYGRTMCGIPSIHLLGTPEDWSSIHTRVLALGEILPSWLHGPMVLVAREFENAAKGKADRKFWKHFFKRDGGSGGPYITGFVNVLFPFEGRRGHKNPLLDPENFKRAGASSFEERVYEKAGGMGSQGPNPDDIHSSISSVPVTWLYYDQTFKMKFAAGIVGVTVDNSIEGGGYRCAMGWMVGESTERATQDA